MYFTIICTKNFRKLIPKRKPRNDCVLVSKNRNLAVDNNPEMSPYLFLLTITCALCIGFPPSKADTIYFNGDILTMAGQVPSYVESLAVGKGRILHAGPLTQSLKYNGSKTNLYNLRGKTLLPGFFDPHSHIGTVGFAVTLGNLFPIPDGSVGSLNEVVQVMKDWKDNNHDLIGLVGWIIGYGYDDSMLTQKHHPTREYLDQISSQLPVIVIHQSFHLGAVNSAALRHLNITAETPDPDGGRYQRYANSTEPNGILQQNAFFDIFDKIDLTPIRAQMILDSQKRYAAGGYTTVQDGRTDHKGVDVLMKLAQNNSFYLDIYSYPDFKSNREMFRNATWKKYIRNSYLSGFRIAGAKLGLDGSIQAKTGWLTKPYFHVPENERKDYAGYPSFKNQSELDSLIKEMFSLKLQILAHVNGDAAISQFLDSISRNRPTSKSSKHFSNLDNLRTVSVHSQMSSSQHLQTMVRLKVIPSFFGEHTYYWGDWHRDQTIGERAQSISPANSAKRLSMLFTEHTDSPIVLPNAIRMIWSVVNRLTRSGRVLGPDERLDVYSALLSVTRYAAIQAFEENYKGSLEYGKLADLVVLDSNPLKVKPDAICQVLVLETIKAGKTVYRYTAEHTK